MRPRYKDYIQVFRFHLLDMSPPALDMFRTGLSFIKVIQDMPGWSGYTSITVPEISVRTKEITVGNQPHSIEVVDKVDYGNVVLKKGLSYDSDFYYWILEAVSGRLPIGIGLGRETFRKNFLLLQFTPVAASKPGLASLYYKGYEIGGECVNKGLRVAKSWLLVNCLPVRYKAGSDLDASSGAISITELEMAPEEFVEIMVPIDVDRIYYDPFGILREIGASVY